MPTTPDRQRSYTWEDPTDLAAAGTRLSGFAYLKAMLDGELPHPPICATLGLRFTELAEGSCAMELVPGEHQYNTIGTVHGGVIATILDSVAGSALHSTLPQGVGYTTVNLTTTFLRAIRRDSGTLRAVGEVVKAGRTIALAEARLLDGEQRVCAHSTATCMILQA